MPDIYYWIKNSATAQSANVAANWSRNAADGSAAPSTVPGNASDDIVVFGDPTTITNDKGFAACTWDLATTIGEMVINSGYKDEVNLTTIDLTLTAASNRATIQDGLFSDDFNAGMFVDMVGTVSNDGRNEVSSINADTMVFVSGISTDETVQESRVNFNPTPRFVDIQADFTTTGLFVGSTIKNTSGVDKTITFTGEHISASTYTTGDSTGDYTDRYILNGGDARVENQDDLTYLITAAGASDRTFFDDGPHPIVKTTSSIIMTPQFKTPISTRWGQTTFYQLILNDSLATFEPYDNLNQAADDYKKRFVILDNSVGSLRVDNGTFNGGAATWVFPCATGGWDLPITGTIISSYGGGTGFTSFFNSIEIAPSGTQGDFARIPAGKKLFCYSLKIHSNAMIKDDQLTNTTTVICVQKPVIIGSWNYTEVTPNTYQSNPNKMTNFYTDLTVQDDMTIGDKLTVGGLIDPTGLELTGVASNPGNSNTIWCDNSSVMYWAGGLKVDGGSLYVDAGNDRVGINSSNPQSTFHVEGSCSGAVTEITEETTLSSSHYIVLCNFASQTDVYLPLAADCPGRVYIIRTLNASGYKCVLNVDQGPPVVDTIDDGGSATSIDINGGKGRIIVSDGMRTWVCVSGIGS